MCRSLRATRGFRPLAQSRWVWSPERCPIQRCRFRPLAASEDPQNAHDAHRGARQEPGRQTAPRHVRPGHPYTANRARPALRIPSAALYGKTAGGKATVRLARDGKAVFLPVVTGTDNGTEVEVLAGLTPEDNVIIRSTGTLNEGGPVVVAH